jgi:hypothetical protein
VPYAFSMYGAWGFFQQISYSTPLDYPGKYLRSIRSVLEWDRQVHLVRVHHEHRRSLAGFVLLASALTRCFSRQSYFTGIRTVASLSLSKTTKNLAGIVWCFVLISPSAVLQWPHWPDSPAH